MSSNQKTAQSGLRTLQRDFSASSSSQPLDIDWPPSPPSQPTKPLTGSQKRLRDIEEALRGMSSKPAQLTKGVAQPLVASKAFNKRPSDPAPDFSSVPAKRPRTEIPKELEPTQFVRSSSSAGTARTKDVKTTTSNGPQKVAKVFLSQEQKAILSLVQDGQSVFYTGSAGMCGFSRIYASSDCSA